MEIYSTEEQQVEAIKSWWRSNGTAVLLGAVIGLGGLYGWRYYQSNTMGKQEQASEAYNQTLLALTSNEQAALAQANDFVENRDDNYGNLLSLQLAKALVEAQDLEKAAVQLRLVQQSEDSALSTLATVRLARVESELNNYDAALAELDKVTSASWQSQVEEIRGDIKLHQGDTSAAAAAYAASIAAQMNPVVQMKLDNIANEA